jgi:aspartate/methionine/tyrosine aminotransferase
MNEEVPTAGVPGDAVTRRYPFTEIRKRLREHKGDVLDFALGAWTLSPPDTVVELLHAAPQTAVRRAGPRDFGAFANGAVAMLRHEYGVEVAPECVLPAPGARAAMSALVTCCVSASDRVLVTEPGYPALAYLAARRGAEVAAVPLDPHRSFEPAFDAVSSAWLRSAMMVGLNYPNNPSGAQIPEHGFADLRERLAPAATLFNDATYAPLVYDTSPRSMLPCEPSVPADQNVVELHSFQKLFALGPLGIAFLVGSESLINAVRDYGDFAWTPLSVLHLEVATRCARLTAQIRQSRELLAARIALLRSTLEAVGFEPYPTPAGMYVLCRVPASIGGTEVTGAQHAAELLLDRYDLGVVGWDVPPNRYLRFSAMFRPEDVETLAELGERLELGAPA